MELSMLDTVYVCGLILLVAVLYSMVGHGGASGYIAVLTFFGYEHGFISTSALILNLIVSLTAFISFKKMGYFDPKLLLPFIVTSIPFSFLGGYLKIGRSLFTILLAVALLFSALRLLLEFSHEKTYKDRVSLRLGLFLGAIIGIVSGMIGIGGGVFLSPILIFAGLAHPKKTAAVASAFIFINSLSGLTGRIIQLKLSIPYPEVLAVFIVIALTGGFVGSCLSSRKFTVPVLQKVLGITLIVAGVKFIIDVVCGKI